MTKDNEEKVALVGLISLVVFKIGISAIGAGLMLNGFPIFGGIIIVLTLL